MNEKLKIIEIFHSIQGESTSSGLPTTFVRLAGCNLACRWCDTQYALSGGAEMELGVVLNTIASLHPQNVCVTGGEPLMQKHTPQLVQNLIDKGFSVSIETNGSKDISVVPPPCTRIMDIKCPSSNHCGSTLSSNLTQLTFRDNIKFVIADRVDFDWALNFTADHDLLAVCPVLFSPALLPPGSDDSDAPLHAEPVGADGGPTKTTPENELSSLLAKARKISKWILESGQPLRLQIPLHKLLWPGQRKGM